MDALTYGIVSLTATYWNFYVAESRGCLAEEDLVVTPHITGGTAETIHQLVQKRIDLAGCSPDELISAVLRGDDLVVVGGIIGRPVSRIISQPEIKRVEDLRGKRVGVNQTSGSVSIVLRAALQERGLRVEDYQQVSVGSTPAMSEALKERKVDAAMLTAPFDFDLIGQGFTALVDVGQVCPNYAFTTINARRSWVEQHREALAAFFRATRRAGEFLLDPGNRRAATQILGEHTSLQGDALERAYDSYKAPGVLSDFGEVEVSALEAVIARMVEQGLIGEGRIRAQDVLLPCWEQTT